MKRLFEKRSHRVFGRTVFVTTLVAFLIVGLTGLVSSDENGEEVSDEVIVEAVEEMEDVAGSDHASLSKSVNGTDESFSINEFTTDQLVLPEGIDTPKPTFGWKFAPSPLGVQNEKQSAYQLVLRDYPAGDEILWTSGKVASDQQTFVPYTGEDLKPGTAYYVDLTVWNGDGSLSDRVTSCFSTGLWPTDADPNPWKGKWIGKADSEKAVIGDVKKASWIAWEKNENLPVGKSVYRKSFDVADPDALETAVGNFTGDNEWRLFLNGENLTHGNHFKQAPGFNILSALRAGKNTLVVEANNAGDTPNPGGCAGILTLIGKDGSKTEIITDESWRASTGSETAWFAPDFDDSAWTNAAVIVPVGSGAWGEVTASAGELKSLPACYLSKKGNLAPRNQKEIKRAVVSIVGLGYYELYLDGEKIGDHVLDPILTDYSKRVPYNVYDVTETLHEIQDDADDVAQTIFPIGVILGNGRFYAPRQANSRSFGVPRLLFQLDIDYSDGSRDRIVSDESWKISTEGPIRENNDFDGEVCDMRRSLNEDIAEDHPDGDYFMENARAGTYAVATTDPVDLLDAPTGKLVAQMIPPMRVNDYLHPVSVKEIKPGVFIYDFGQNFVGWVGITARGDAGTEITLRHAETLIQDGPDAGSLYTANLRTAKARDIFILGESDDPQFYTPRFTYHGFRYVEVTGYPGTPTLDDLIGCVVGTDVPRTGWFESSNATIDQVFQNIVWGTRGNYLSIPTDCPQRDERQGWLGDRAVGSKGEMFLFNNETLYRKWMQDIEDSQRDDGNVSDVCPNYWELYGSNVTWPSAQSIIPESLYLMFGDRTAIDRHYDSRKKWLNHIATFLKPDGTLDKDNYDDWCVPPESKELIHSQDPARKTNPGILATAYYAYNLKLAANFAEMLGKMEDATEFRTRSEAVQKALNDVYYDSDKGRYDNGTQTSCVLPLAFGFVPAGEEDKVFKTLVENIENVTNRHVGTGLIGAQWLNRVLSDRGRIDLSYAFATNVTYPSWGYMAEKGATTIWELWNGDTADPAMNSGNHVMLVGDEAIWLYEYLAGIKADEANPGFKRILMKPHVIGDLTWVNANYESIRGLISSSWEMEEGEFIWNVLIPVNSTAFLSVPTTDPDSVTVTSMNGPETDKLAKTTAGDGRVEFELGSGLWVITSKLDPAMASK